MHKHAHTFLLRNLFIRQNPATLLHASPPPVEIDLTVEAWSDFKTGGWERLLAQLWDAPELSALRAFGPPDGHVEVWRQLAAATDDASRSKPTQDQFERIDSRASRAQYTDVQGLGVVDISEPVLVVRLPRTAPPPPPRQSGSPPPAQPCAPMQWLSPAPPEDLEHEYKSLYTCARRCPAIAKFKMMEYLGPFVSACINADINGVIMFGVMEPKEAGVLAVRHGIADDAVWPKVVGFELNVNSDVDDVCVRQELISRFLLGPDPALVVEEWDEASGAFKVASAPREKMNLRIKPETCKVQGGGDGAEMPQPRWAVKVHVFGKTSKDLQYDPVRFLCRHRPFSAMPAAKLQLDTMLFDAAVKAIEDRAAGSLSLTVKWDELWAAVCDKIKSAEIKFEPHAPFDPSAKAPPETSFVSLIVAQFGSESSECTVNSLGQLDVGSIAVSLGTKKVGLRECCKQLAAKITTHLRAVVNRDHDVCTLRKEENRIKTADGPQSSEYAAAKARTEERQRVVEAKARRSSVDLAQHLRKFIMHGDVPSTWEWSNYYTMSSVSGAVACFRTHHGSASAKEGNSRKLSGADVYSNDVAPSTGEIDARKTTLLRHVEDWKAHNVLATALSLLRRERARWRRRCRRPTALVSVLQLGGREQIQGEGQGTPRRCQVPIPSTRSKRPGCDGREKRESDEQAALWHAKFRIS